MSLKALIDNQLAALNDPANFEHLLSSIDLVQKLMSNPRGDVLDTRTAMKKEVLKLEKLLNKREGVEMLAYRLITLSAFLVSRARERVVAHSFSILARPPPITKSSVLALVLAKIVEKRVRIAMRKCKEKAEIVGFARNKWKSESAPNRKMSSVVLLSNCLLAAKWKRERMVVTHLRCLCKRAKSLSKFARFFTIRKCFLLVVLQPKSRTLKEADVIHMKSVLLKLISVRVNDAMTKLKPEITESEELVEATKHAVKQTAFSSGPFATINAKVFNSKSLAKWGYVQLVGALNTARMRNIEKAFETVKLYWREKKRVILALERRVWKYRNHLKSSLQLRMNRWWRRAKEKSTTSFITQFKRKLYLRRVIKDKRIQTSFRKWKHSCKPMLSFSLKTDEIAAYKLARLRLKRIRAMWSQMVFYNLKVKRQSLVGAQTVAIALKRVLIRTRSVGFQKIYQKYRCVSRYMNGCLKLIRMSNNKRKVAKTRSLAKIRAFTYHSSSDFQTNYQSKVKSTIEIVNFVSNLRLKRLYHTWNLLALRLKFTAEEVRLRLTFQRLKNKIRQKRNNIKEALKNAIRAVKNNHRSVVQKAFIRWGFAGKLIGEKAIKGKLFYPTLAGKLDKWYLASVESPWEILDALRIRHHNVKEFTSQIPFFVSRMILRLGLQSLLLNRNMSKEQSSKSTSARKMILISEKRLKSHTVNCLFAAWQSAKSVSKSKVRCLLKLAKWANRAAYPHYLSFFTKMQTFDWNFDINFLARTLMNRIRKKFLFPWAKLKLLSGKSIDKRELHHRLAALSLLHSDKLISWRSELHHFRSWKQSTSIYLQKLHAVKLLSLTISTRLDLLSQQAIGAIRRCRYQRIALRNRGRRVYQLIVLNSKESGIYSKIEKLSKVAKVGIHRSMLFALQQIAHNYDSLIKAENLTSLRQRMIQRLTVRKGKTIVQKSFSRWRILTMSRLTSLSNSFLSRRLAFASLDTYRRKVLLIGTWSTMRRLAIERHWKRKHATTVVADALTTLKVAYLQTAFA